MDSWQRRFFPDIYRQRSIGKEACRNQVRPNLHSVVGQQPRSRPSDILRRISSEKSSKSNNRGDQTATENQRSYHSDRWTILSRVKKARGFSHAPNAESNGETDFDLGRAFDFPYDWKGHNEHDDIGDNIHKRTPTIPRISIDAVAPLDLRIPKKVQRDANHKSGNHHPHKIGENQSCRHIACDTISTLWEDTKI